MKSVLTRAVQVLQLQLRFLDVAAGELIDAGDVEAAQLGVGLEADVEIVRDDVEELLRRVPGGRLAERGELIANAGLLDFRLGEDLAHLLPLRELDAALLLVLGGELRLQGLLGERRAVGIRGSRRRGRAAVARVLAVAVVLAHLGELLLVGLIELVETLLLLELLLVELGDLLTDLLSFFLEFLVLLLQRLAPLLGLLLARLPAAFVRLARLEHESQAVVSARGVADRKLVTLELRAVCVALEGRLFLVVGILVGAVAVGIVPAVVGGLGVGRLRLRRVGIRPIEYGAQRPGAARIASRRHRRGRRGGRGARAWRRHVGRALREQKFAERRPGVELDVGIRNCLGQRHRYGVDLRRPAQGRHPVYLAQGEIPHPEDAAGLQPPDRRLARGEHEGRAVAADAEERAQRGLLADRDGRRVPAHAKADRLHLAHRQQVLAQRLAVAAAQDVSCPGHRTAGRRRRRRRTGSRGSVARATG